jgi:fructoselysine-6-P-deglycase FrlB-like protein
MSEIDAEIASQPDVWRRAEQAAAEYATRLPRPGESVAVVGCGTSLYIAQAYAAAREEAGLGVTDAFPASEFPAGRPYDLVLAISRSGTTTEVVRALDATPAGSRTVAIVAVGGTPVTHAASSAIVLEYADERSVVQTRAATGVLAMLRAHLGESLAAAVADGERALAEPLPLAPDGFRQFVFLGRGWTVGLANEAALKLREAAIVWSESYPAMEYRHGPISVADERTAVWPLGAVDDALLTDVAATGATVVEDGRDPMASLVLAQRVAVALARARGLDPDRPRNLARSVVLDDG